MQTGKEKKMLLVECLIGTEQKKENMVSVINQSGNFI